MKTTMKGAALFLALSALSFAASAQDWRGDHDRGRSYDRGQQQAQNGNNGWQRDGNRDGRGDNRDNRGWAGNNNGNWQRGGYGYRYGQRPPMPPRGYYGYDRGRDYRYAPPPRVVYGSNDGRRYYSAGYGYQSQPVWMVGSRYYGDDYAPTYVVDDYGDYGLYAPPRGYGWRRDDFGHYLLVAITTGIIADLLFGH